MLAGYRSNDRALFMDAAWFIILKKLEKLIRHEKSIKLYIRQASELTNAYEFKCGVNVIRNEIKNKIKIRNVAWNFPWNNKKPPRFRSTLIKSKISTNGEKLHDRPTAWYYFLDDERLVFLEHFNGDTSIFEKIVCSAVGNIFMLKMKVLLFFAHWWFWCRLAWVRYNFTKFVDQDEDFLFSRFFQKRAA